MKINATMCQNTCLQQSNLKFNLAKTNAKNMMQQLHTCNLKGNIKLIVDFNTMCHI